MWSVWYQAKLCVNERQKETFGFLLTRKLSVQEITLARLKMLTVVTVFSEYFVLFITKASNFYKRKLMACFPAAPAVKAS